MRILVAPGVMFEGVMVEAGLRTSWEMYFIPRIPAEELKPAMRPVCILKSQSKKK